MRIRSVVGGSLLGAMLLALVGAAPARAVTVYTYTFEQQGFTGVGFAENGTLTGGFTGVADSNGDITLGSVTDFHFTLSGFTTNVGGVAPNGSASGINLLKSFFFRVSDPGLFGFESEMPYSNFVNFPRLCLGAQAGFVCAAPGNPHGAIGTVDVPFYTPVYYTASWPTLTLVSATTTTPLPASLVLFATALGGLVGCRVLRRHA